MKVFKKLMSVMLLTTPAVFSATTLEGGLLLSELDCAVASTTGIAAASPRSDVSLSDPIDLEISATTTLTSMLPHLAEGSRRKIEEIIAILQGSGEEKFKEAQTMLRACEIIADEVLVEREDSPVNIEQASIQKNLRLLNQDVLHVIRSLEVYIRELPTEDDYEADTENCSAGSVSPGDLD